MLVVGLTGGIGSGKSAVAARFERLGVPVVDTDAISHALTRRDGAALPPIRAHFGDAVLDAMGALDRAVLRRIVFTDPAARSALEAILHPLIRREVARQLAALDAPYAIVAIPLLVETGGWRDIVQRVLLVDCPVAIRIERVVARSGLDHAEVQAIVDAQAGDAERRAVADDVLDNTGPQQALDAAVAQLHARYLVEAGTPRS
ncbi:MAG: dephospho-CoA kinase [Pseudomonadota bacterium]